MKKVANIFASILILLIFSSSIPGKIKRPYPAPEFEMQTFEGGTVFSESLKGKIIVMEFWDTFCSPCRRLMPSFEELVDKYNDNSDVVIWQVNAGWETFEKAKTFVDKKQFDLNFSYMEKKTSKKLKVRELPCTIIIDQEFNVVYKHAGCEEDEDETFMQHIDEMIEGLLI